MRTRSLQTRLTLLVLVIALPLMITAMILLSNLAGDALNQFAKDQLGLINNALNGNVKTWLALNTQTLQELVGLPDIVSMDASRQKTVLKAIATAHPQVYLAMTLNLSGFNVARNDEEQLRDYHDRQYFLGAKSGSVTLETIVSRTTGRPALALAAPIRDSSGQIVGVGMIGSELEDISRQVNASKVGRTGEAYVVDVINRIVAHSDPAVVSKPELVDASQFPPVVALRQGKTGYTTFVDEQGRRWYAHMDRLENGWGIIVQQQESELLSTLWSFRTITSVLILVGACLLAAMMWFTIRQVMRPIGVLTDTTAAIAAGDLTRTAPVQGEDELGVLARSFNTMTSQLRDMISSLELRVEARTAQLRASAEVGRAISTILDPQELLQRLVDLICERFGFYYAGVFLLDRDRRFAVLRAGRGEAGRALLDSGHRLEVGGQSMVGWVCANRQARIALDVGQDAVRLVNPLLPDTRSEIALPLRIGERVLGALDVQSVQEAAFDESSIAVLQGMADQIAIALENARLFAETQTALAENQRLVSQIQASLQETAALYEASQAISTAPDTEAIFQAMVEHSLKPEIDLCLLVLFEPYEGEKPEYLKVSHVWTREPVTLDPLRADTRTAFADFPLRSLLTAEPSGLVQSYDPGDQQMWRHLPPGLQSIAFVPLIAGAKWIGALGLGTSSQSALTAEWLKPYQSLAAQAAVSIENRRLIESTQASLQELNVLYRQVMRETWQRALQSRPTLTEYDYAPTGQAAGDGSKLEMPLTLRGQEIGVVELTSAGRQAWTEQERALVEAVVTQAALALDSARLFDETQRLAGRERLINEITARIRATTSVSAILQTAARELAQALDVPHAVARIQIDESARPVTKSGG